MAGTNRPCRQVGHHQTWPSASSCLGVVTPNASRKVLSLSHQVTTQVQNVVLQKVKSI